MLRIEQFAAMNILYSRYSLDYFLRSMADIGYDNIEFWGSIPHYDLFADQLQQQDQIRKIFSKYGLKMICFTPEQCVYPFNIAAKEENIRRKSVEFFTRCLQDAAGFATDKMLLTPGWGNYDEDAKEAWKRSMDSTEKLIRVAEKEGIVICYEILQPFESNLVTDLSSLRRVMDIFDSDYLKICVDTVPVAVAGESLRDFFDAFGDRIAHIHLNDGDPSGHMAWGDGNLDLREHLAALQGYEGYITFETADTKYTMDPNRAFRNNLDAVSKFFEEGRIVI